MQIVHLISDNEWMSFTKNTFKRTNLEENIIEQKFCISLKHNYKKNKFIKPKIFPLPLKLLETCSLLKKN